jgi:hypothetical protein
MGVGIRADARLIPPKSSLRGNHELPFGALENIERAY